MGLYITVDGPSGVGKSTISRWLLEYFEKENSVILLKDNEMDPLRDLAVKIVPWCRQNNLDPKEFLLPLFAAGYQISEKKLKESLAMYDVVIRDRSFVSALAYQTASRRFTPGKIWDLCAYYLDLRVPDCAVIVDGADDVALKRINSRSQKDIGLGGKMSSGRTQHERVADRFRELVDPDYWLPERLNICYVYNNDAFSDDSLVVQSNIDAKGKYIIAHLYKTGVIR